jgi:UDP-GlcNAc3NAcA epimerase
MKIVSVVGARPQFVKAAVVSVALRESGYHEFVVHTGQHYDKEMSQVFFDELQIPQPDVNLGAGSGSHGYQTGQMLMRLETVLDAQKPDWVLVYGDTNSTLAGALAASKLRFKLAHVEAGMRSHDRAMPEEVNRVLTDHVSDLLFCATQTAVENLRHEGITQGVHFVGDVMYDALLRFAPIAMRQSDLWRDMALQPKNYVLLTLHRAESVDSTARLRALLAAIRRVDFPVLFPIHPRTRQRLAELGALDELGSRVRILPPLGYLDTIALAQHARAVLTDSGGLQREAFFLGVPSIILRRQTEWPELLDAGASRLAGPEFENIWPPGPGPEAGEWPRSLFGDGHASRRIAICLERS